MIPPHADYTAVDTWQSIHSELPRCSRLPLATALIDKRNQPVQTFRYCKLWISFSAGVRHGPARGIKWFGFDYLLPDRC